MWDLFEEPLPDFLVFAIGLFEIFQNAVEVGVGAEIVPGGIFLEPRVILIA